MTNEEHATELIDFATSSDPTRRVKWESLMAGAAALRRLDELERWANYRIKWWEETFERAEIDKDVDMKTVCQINAIIYADILKTLKGEMPMPLENHDSQNDGIL